MEKPEKQYKNRTKDLARSSSKKKLFVFNLVYNSWEGFLKDTFTESQFPSNSFLLQDKNFHFLKISIISTRERKSTFYYFINTESYRIC